MGMNAGMKMMLMNNVRRNEHYPQSEYGSGDGRRMIGYDRPENTYRDRDNDGRYNEDRRYAYGGMDYPESRRRRDSRGRFMENEHMTRMGGYRGEYDESRYGMDGRYEPESRRRRDSRGRYAMGGRDPRMMDDDYDDDDDVRGQMWHPPEMYGNSRYGIRDVYADIHTGGVANRPMDGGMMNGDVSAPVDERTARMWVRKMDGGEHFQPEQIEPLRQTMCQDCSKWEWYTAMNAMYSDHCETAKKLGMDKPDFYAHLAKDFLMDSDAKPHKLRRYMEHIAK